MQSMAACWLVSRPLIFYIIIASLMKLKGRRGLSRPDSPNSLCSDPSPFHNDCAVLGFPLPLPLPLPPLILIGLEPSIR